MTSISIYGAGQLGTNVAQLLRDQNSYAVSGPHARDQDKLALDSGADVVIIATTTLFRDVKDDIIRAVKAGSNVLVSAEECAYPWAVDPKSANEIAELAIKNNVSVAGCGVNPGLIFDGLVLTFLGSSPRGVNIIVRRTVDISGFGRTVLNRIGVGWTGAEFETKVNNHQILGHAGFPQSMSLVADALGLKIDHIDRELLPVFAESQIALKDKSVLDKGLTAGVNQTYTAVVAGNNWFTSYFFGHVDLDGIGKKPQDEIEFVLDGKVFQTIKVNPGIGAQMGSQNMVVNSIDRISTAAPGWVTLTQLPPAFPKYGESFLRQ